MRAVFTFFLISVALWVNFACKRQISSKSNDESEPEIRLKTSLSESSSLVTSQNSQVPFHLRHLAILSTHAVVSRWIQSMWKDTGLKSQLTEEMTINRLILLDLFFSFQVSIKDDLAPFYVLPTEGRNYFVLHPDLHRFCQLANLISSLTCKLQLSPTGIFHIKRFFTAEQTGSTET